MKAVEIKIGKHYTAKVNGSITTVRVDAIRQSTVCKGTTYYDVTNTKTGRRTVFSSPRKFRKEVSPFVPTVRTPAPIPMTQPNNTTVATVEASSPGDSAKPITEETEQCLELEQTPVTPSLNQPTPCSMENSMLTNSNSMTQQEPSTPPLSPESVDAKPVGLAANLRAAITTTTSSGHKLTDEQQAILDVAPTVQVLVIEAGAGSGKTFECLELTKVLGGNGQYTAFNSKLVEDSKTKFPKHVPCNTIHSLGFRAEGKKHAHRLDGRRVMAYEVAAMLGLRDLTIDGLDGKPKVLNAGLLASQVTRAIRNFCQSADRELSTRHLPRFPGIDAEHSTFNSDAVKEYLLPFTQKMWADKCNPSGTLPFTHDDYVKMWEMSDPYIAADYILLDEAQDTSPVMLSIMEQQVKRGTKIILVGDSAQQIYSWRGAINALAAFPDAPRLMLSQSFRFGQVVAEVANAVLSNLQMEPTKLVMKGFDKINSRLATLKNPTAILCRTNAGAVSHLLDGIQRGKKPHLYGGSNDVAAFVRAAGDLQNGKSTSHPELCCFANWKEVESYVKTDEGEELKLLVKIINQFKVGPLLKALSNMPAEKDSDLIISTAHKSKGCEWSGVKLAEDFMPISKMGDEEVRLLYVAATRAKDVLDVETCPPFCGGQRSRDEGDGELRTIDISKARRLSKEIVVPVETVPEPTPEVKAEVPVQTSRPYLSREVNGNTWTKGRDGSWLVRGKPGQTGAVEVTRKNNTKSVVTIKKVVWQDGTVALYEVVA